MLPTKLFEPFEEFEKGFSKLFHLPELFHNNHLEADFAPRVNTKETSTHYELEVELPGVAKEEIHLHLEENILTLSGEKKFSNKESKENYKKVETFYGKFIRSFTLPKGVSETDIQAREERGIIYISIQKPNVNIQPLSKNIKIA